MAVVVHPDGEMGRLKIATDEIYIGWLWFDLDETRRWIDGGVVSQHASRLFFSSFFLLMIGAAYGYTHHALIMNDLTVLVDIVCDELQQPGSTPMSPLDGGGPAASLMRSRHARLCEAAHRSVDEVHLSIKPMLFLNAIDDIMRRHRTLMDTPVHWVGEGDANDQREQELTQLRREFAEVLQQYAPHLVKLVWAGVEAGLPPGSPTTTASATHACPMCTSNTVGALIIAPGASGACEVCQSVLYDHADRGARSEPESCVSLASISRTSSTTRSGRRIACRCP